MRLIDADNLDFTFDRRCFSEGDTQYVRGVDDAIGVVNNAPTIDAVPVVRCRECIYYKICDEWETGKRMLCEIHHHSYLDHDGDEHFCSWGQRREAEHDKHPSDPL